MSDLTLPPSASSVVARARSLAAYANQIYDDVHTHAAAITADDFHAWSAFYAQSAAPTIDPFTDPPFGIVPNPIAAWAELDGIEPELDDWRARVNGWTGLTRPVVPSAPLPSVPIPDPPPGWTPSAGTKVLVGLGLVVALVALWRLK